MTRHLLKQGASGSGGRYGAYLVPNKSESRSFQVSIVLNHALPCVLAPLDCSLSHSAHHLVRTEFSQFSTTSPTACLYSNYLLCVTVSTYLVADFSPPLLKIYYVYWQILRIKFVTFSGQIYSNQI